MEMHGGMLRCDGGFLQALSQRTLSKSGARGRTRSCSSATQLMPMQGHPSKALADLRRSMRAKSNRGFRAELASQTSLPNRRPSLDGLDMSPGGNPMAPLKMSPKERHRLSASALDLCRKSCPALRAQTAAARLRSEPLKEPADSMTFQLATKPVKEVRQDSKPTEQQRKASRQRFSKRKVTMSLSSPEKDSKSLPAPDTGQVGPLCLSVSEALHRFHRDGLGDAELKRMRVCFNRLCSEDGEVYRGILHEALITLGYVTITEDKSLELAMETTEFSTFDFQDFVDFCDRCTMHEREVLQSNLETWVAREETPGVVYGPVEEAQAFMRTLGVFCQKAEVEAIIELGGLSGRPCTSSEELLRVLAAWRACEGFGHEECDSIKDSFEECEQMAKVNQGPEGKLIQPGELSNGLLDYGGLYSVEHLQKIMNQLEEGIQGDHAVGVPFFEFLAYARRLKDAMLKEVLELFENLDDDNDGFIEAEELRELCQSLGFHLVDAEWQELCEATHTAEDDWVEFSAAYRFVEVVRDRNGFTEGERDELVGNFNSFCDESGEMPNLQVFDLLQYLGFENTMEEVREMVERVDFNGNGTMDSGEFMRLMRMQREKSLRGYRAAYEQHRLGEEGCAKASELQAALEAAGLKPTPEILQKALLLRKQEGHYDEKRLQLSYEAFLLVAETCRKLVPVENRKNAHFNSSDLAMLESAFFSQDLKKQGYISIGDLLWQLADCSLQVNTAAGRATLYEQLDKAREAALAVGIDTSEVGNPGSPRVRLKAVIHLVRAVVGETLKAVHSREGVVLEAVKFSGQEVVEFRTLFRSLVQKSKGENAEQEQPESPLSGGGRRHSVTLAQVPVRARTLGTIIDQFKRIDRVPLSEVSSMISSMGVRISLDHKLAFGEKLKEASQGHQDGLDFPGFLQVMRWVLDFDLGNINTTAESAVKSAGLTTLDPFAHMRSAVNVQARQHTDARRMSI
eukprot:TRINITY_DN32011_c0_g1_i1.p1 TRINITY_DN32011_c0_g1~~TRINITY_DN32011_c0_g1_i1.p1  ORF type:complete len:968 (-),score=219.62 TRINITY_DN32011_c0_g1_i1:53-2956(-)